VAACGGELVGVTHLCDSDLDSARVWVQELEHGVGDLSRASARAYSELSGVCTQRGSTAALGLGRTQPCVGRGSSRVQEAAGGELDAARGGGVRGSARGEGQREWGSD